MRDTVVQAAVSSDPVLEAAVSQEDDLRAQLAVETAARMSAEAVAAEFRVDLVSGGVHHGHGHCGGLWLHTVGFSVQGCHAMAEAEVCRPRAEFHHMHAAA